MKKVASVKFIHRLVFNMLYMLYIYQGLCEALQSHLFSFILLGGIVSCTIPTLYWPINCKITHTHTHTHTHTRNSWQAAANTRHCSLRNLLGKYKSLHLTACLCKQASNGVYFWIQGHKIYQ